MVKPTPTQPSRSASSTLAVSAWSLTLPPARLLALFSFRISGISPA